MAFYDLYMFLRAMTGELDDAIVEITDSDDDSIIRLYRDGTKVRSISVEAVRLKTWRDDRRSIREYIYRVESSDGRVMDFHRRKNAYDWAELVYRFGAIPYPLTLEKVPTEVALDGKPAIATYLTLAGPHQGTPEKGYVYELFDVEPSTIGQYASDFRNRIR